MRSPSSVRSIVDMGARSQVQFEVFPNLISFRFIAEKWKANLAGSIGIASALLIYWTCKTVAYAGKKETRSPM